MIPPIGNKLLIYAPYAIWGPHFETELELAERHLNAGGKVVFLCCTGQALTCFPNQSHRRSICRMCMARFRKGMAWLGRSRVAVKDFFWVTSEQQREIDFFTKQQFSSPDDVRSLSLQGADLGVGAISSVFSILREPKPDVVEHEVLIRLNLLSAARVFFSMINHIKAEQPDAVALFNGRYAQLRPALSAARNLGVPALVHERAGVLDRFSLLVNTTPHDYSTLQREMRQIYESSPLSEAAKMELARAWFEERRNNVTQGWESFTKEQKPDHLPELALDRLNLALFISSEDELEAFEEWRSPYYADQNEGIERLLSDTRLAGKYRIFLREHPNMKGLGNSQTRRLRELASIYGADLQFITADSTISTYGLLDVCDLVLTYGSTVGIEAVYRGKPSFLMGRAYYENLGCCVVPSSHEELIRLLGAFADGDRSMLPPPGDCARAASVYGFFNKSWGYPFAHVQVTGLRTVLMMRGNKATRLRPSLASWLMFQLEELLS